MTALLVVLGAAVGAPLRLLAADPLEDDLPAGTLLVNATGSFLLGLSTALSLSGETTALLGVGLCGAMTTYSSFAVQVAERVRRRESRRLGVLYALLTVGLAVGLCAVGFWLGTQP